MLDDFAYGRKDAASASECGSLEIPGYENKGSFVSYLRRLDFSEEEIVALASVEAFGQVVNPEHARWSSQPKLDTYYY